MGTFDFSKLNIDQTKSNGRQTLDQILGGIANRYKKDISRPGAALADHLKNLDHAADKAVFSSQGDAYDALQDLFGAVTLRHVVGSACHLGQLDREAWTALKASNPEAFAEHYDAATDLLAWAQAMKHLADELFAKAAVA